ncbi:hypothetical protein EYC59_02430 [Candidatus Saccharibacteria bacterium]|nr:MAG: hypothetical protein EYC59_02430 [Candidatus Saccharibacteria bacterium]
MNEENKTPEPGVVPQGTPQNENTSPASAVAPVPPVGSGVVVQAVPPPKQHMGLFAKIFIGIAVAISLVVTAGMVLVFYVFSSFTSVCDGVDKNMNRAQTDLQTQSAQVTVAGNHLQSVSVYPNGDCLTGSGVVLDASVLAGGTLEQTHTAMLQAFGLTAGSEETMRVENDATAGAGDVTRVVVNQKKDNREYTFTYILSQPVNCTTTYADIRTCWADPGVVQKLGLFDKPVVKAKIYITQYIDR